MSLNAPHHKEQEYIWFMGGDLNGFHDIMQFYEKSRWGMSPGDPGIHVTKCGLSGLPLSGRTTYITP